MTTTIETYNGWTNRETWATKLHLDNDQVMQEMAQDYTLTALSEHSSAEDCSAVACLAESLEYWITEDLLTRENIAGNEGLWMMLSDIGSLYRVNWRELAEAYISDQPQQEEGE